MSRTPYYDENDNYFGPRAFTGGFFVAGGGGSFQTPPLTGYVDTLLYDTDSSDSFDVAFTRELADESLFTKTGLTSGAIVRPSALEAEAEDGGALTTRRRIWLQNEIVTVTVSNATNGVEFSATIVTLPH